MKLKSKIIHRLKRIIQFKKGVYGTFGEECKFMHNVFINEGTRMGSYNYVGPSTIITDAKIGNYCSIAPFAKIGLGEHRISAISTSGKIMSMVDEIPFSLTEKEIIIGNDVWIGTQTVIKRGVRVGDGAIVGAGSIVTKDVPDFAIVVGVPAKIIKYRFTQEVIDIIKDSNWWEYKKEDATKIILDLQKKIKSYDIG